eukprot:scaffold15920_cov129-Isochrysis_galbana.AAC.2
MGKQGIRGAGSSKPYKPNRGGRVVTIGGGAGAAGYSESDRSDDDSEEEEEGRRWSDDSEVDDGSEAEEDGHPSEAEESEASIDDGLATDEEKAAKAKQRASTKRWEAKHFVQKSKSSSGGTIYKTKLLPEMAFHTHATFVEFLKGSQFQKLLAECRKGMRTHNDNEQLKQKAEARRARAEQRRAVKKRERRLRRKEKVAQLPESEIEKRKDAFQAKKARRLARKEAAAKALG